MTRTLVFAALLAAAGLGPAALSAQTAPPGNAAAAATPAATPWASLSEADRAALIEPTRERWERATPEQQQRMLDRARFWASLSAEQKRLARAGVERWRDASPEQRARMREAWQRRQEQRRERRGE